MKIILLSLILLSTTIFSQTYTYKSLQEIELSFRQTLNQSGDFNYRVNSFVEQEKKSVGLGIIYSLLLPGMGELYADAYGIGKYFTIADGLLWGTFIGMNAYSNWQVNNYKTYAAVHAGVDNNNKDSDFYSTIANYTSVDSYNNEKALERNFDEMYDENAYFWKWNSTNERQTYREMWTSGEQVKNDIRFVVGGLILNRIASAINAARLVSSYNNRLKDEVSWNFSVGLINQLNLPTSISLNFQKSF